MPLLLKRGASRAPILRAAKTHEAQKWPGEVLLYCLNMKELGFEVQKRQPKNTNEHAGDLLRKCMLHRSLSLTHTQNSVSTHSGPAAPHGYVDVNIGMPPTASPRATDSPRAPIKKL